MPASAPRLKYLSPAWYAIVMGLSGLAMAWHRAAPLLGDTADAVSLALGVLAAAVFVALVLAGLVRLQRHREAWVEDLRHPVRHAFVAAIPISA
ncbi:MAG: C4-dicarboxylate ABC transporter, partial [Proteobacteria bacterium]|nr:C4-dicarboxylate ABC transporter [Pseudomonadota bacterium]